MAEDTVIRLEAEKAEKLGSPLTALEERKIGAKLSKEGDGVLFSLDIPREGFWDLTVRNLSAGGARMENHVKLDGQPAATLVTAWPVYHDVMIPRIYMTQGTHQLSIEAGSAFISIDYITLTPSEEMDADLYEVSPTLVNPNASENARRLMHYLCDIYGEYTLSGQYCDRGRIGPENRTIYRATGLYPAVLGMDMMDYSPYRVEKGAQSVTVIEALEYWEKQGGIITLAWHWGVDGRYILDGYDKSGNPRWWGNFYTENVNFSLAAALDGRDPEGYEMLLEGIDAISLELKKLAEKDVPILWRPLHEASGKWFWWGASGDEPYKELWKLMYDRMTNHHGLNNLIWLWNGQDKGWYPGDEYVDIIGEDIYPDAHDHSSQSTRFLDATRYTDAKKLIVLSENGTMPDPDLMLRDGAMWGFFATWSGDFITSGGYNLSNKYTDADMLKKIYTHPLVLTRDEVPDIRTYPLPQ